MMLVDVEDDSSGVHTWIVPDNLVFADGAAAALFGFTAEEGRLGKPLADYTNRIHPVDLPRVSRSISISMDSGRPYQEEYRICRPDGTTVDVAAFGAWFHNANGEPTHYAGILMEKLGEQPSELTLLQQLALSYDLAVRDGYKVTADRVLDAIAELSVHGNEMSLDLKQVKH